MLVSGGSVAESPAPAFVFQGWPLHLPRRLGKRVAKGTAEQCKGPSEEVGACRKLSSEVSWKAQDTLHRKRQHNFLIKLKSVARS